MFRYIPINIAKQLDLRLDGSASVDSGNVRHKSVVSSNEHVFIKVMTVR